jgi:short-subunit dehydrogenase
MSTRTTVLITGASTGIGAIYADRFARRGHDLVLVARDKARLETLAARLRRGHRRCRRYPCGRPDPAWRFGRRRGAPARGRQDRHPDQQRRGRAVRSVHRPIDRRCRQPGHLNTPRCQAGRAIAPRLAQAGKGAIVNIGSVVGLAPEFGMSVYGATKAFVLFLSQGLSLELKPKGVYVQAVLPAGTRTEIWERAGIDISAMPDLMDVGRAGGCRAGRIRPP